jgi:signal peptidase I
MRVIDATHQSSQPETTQPFINSETESTPAAKPLWRSLLEVLIAVALIVFLTQALFSVVTLTADNMSPTLRMGQSVLISRLPYALNAPERGDVVAIRSRIDPSRLLIYRVVGIQGDRVDVKGAQVTINNRPLREPYLPESAERLGVSTTSIAQYRIGPDEYFLLNDNRADTDDSRTSGLFQRDDFYGRAWLVFWPLENIRLISHTRPIIES